MLPGWAVFMEESNGLAPSADGEQGPKHSKRTSGSFPSLGTSPSCLTPMGWDLAQHQSRTSQEEVPGQEGGSLQGLGHQGASLIGWGLFGDLPGLPGKPVVFPFLSSLPTPISAPHLVLEAPGRSGLLCLTLSSPPAGGKMPVLGNPLQVRRAE